MAIKQTAINKFFHLSRFNTSLPIGLAIFLISAYTLAEDTVVSFKFDWPQSLQGSIENYSHFTNRVKNDGEHRVQTDMIWRSMDFVVSEQSEGLQFDNEVTKSSYRPEPGKQEIEEQLWQLAIKTVPSYTVSKQGEFSGLVNEQEMHDKVSAEIGEKYQESLEELPEHILDELDYLFSSDYHWTTTYNNWERDVGQWVDSEMAIGIDNEEGGTLVLPFWENVELPFRTTTTLLGFISCDAKPGDKQSKHEKSGTSSKSTTCVEIESVSKLDEEAVAQFVEDTNNENGTDPEMQWKPKLHHKLNVITDPNTLIPRATSEIDVLSLDVDGSTIIIYQQGTQNTYNYEF